MQYRLSSALSALAALTVSCQTAPAVVPATPARPAPAAQIESAPPDPPEDASIPLGEQHARIRAEATTLSGAPEDIPQRVLLMYRIYRDSGGNHVFPLVALHGALWAKNFFDETGPVASTISARYFYDADERASRAKMLADFTRSFQDANRQVFIDTYTNYYFSKRFGKSPGAADFLPSPELRSGLARLHDARTRRAPLSRAQRRELYLTALTVEQEQSVAPRIKVAMDAFTCPILKHIVLAPPVRFQYFKPEEVFYFKDISDKTERIEKATRAYEIAEDAGWDEVVRSMKSYDVLPEGFFEDPDGFTEQLRAKILGREAR